MTAPKDKTKLKVGYGGAREGAGRPSKYSEATASAICEKLAQGISLTKMCEAEDMPSRMSVLRWEDQHPEFVAKCARARLHQADAAYDEIMGIEADIRGGSLDPNAGRVLIGSKQWRAGRLASNKYGDKVATTVSGPDGGAVRHEIVMTVVDPRAK